MIRKLLFNSSWIYLTDPSGKLCRHASSSSTSDRSQNLTLALCGREEVRGLQMGDRNDLW